MLVNYDFSSDEEKDVIKKEIKTLNRNDKEEKNQKIVNIFEKLINLFLS